MAAINKCNKESGNPMRLCGESTGFPAEKTAHCPLTLVRPGDNWMTEEIIQKTREVWSAVYGWIISDEEAQTILREVKTIGEVLIQAAKEMESD